MVPIRFSVQNTVAIFSTTSIPNSSLNLHASFSCFYAHLCSVHESGSWVFDVTIQASQPVSKPL